MTVEQLASIIAPFVAVLGASAWLHGTLAGLRETIAALTERIKFLEREVERLKQLESHR